MPAGPDPSELLISVAKGDRAALKALYTRLSARLFGIVLAILRDRAAAADVLQDGFLAVWERARQFDPSRAKAEIWLTALFRHIALDRARVRGREGLGLPEADAIAADALPAGEGAGLSAGLARLDPKTRQAVLLGYVHGLSHADIAAMLDQPVGAIAPRLRGGLLGLRGSPS